MVLAFSLKKATNNSPVNKDHEGEGMVFVTGGLFSQNEEQKI